nr:hypothetical protein [Prevotella sp.]
MVKFFKIIEKIVWIIAALAIAAVLAMVFIGAFANLDKDQFDWSSYIPYFYGAAAVVVLYKIVVLYYTSFYQTEIDEKTGMLVSLDDEMKKFRANSQEGSLPDAKFEAIMEAVKQIPQTDTNAILTVLQERIPSVVQTLVDQQVAEIKRNLMLENEKRMREINILSANVSDVLERREHLLNLEAEIKRCQEEERKRRLTNTEEYTMLVFSLAGTPVEDVEKVCDVVKLFIETSQVSANKDLGIPLNKKLRNAELKQFVTNIIRYNKKDNLDGDSFLQTAFCEWFSGKKENIAKNYSVLPKDSLVSKDGVEADLIILRKLIGKNQDNGDRVLINKFVVI